MGEFVAVLPVFFDRPTLALAADDSEREKVSFLRTAETLSLA